MSAERETSALPASGLAVVIALVLGIVAVKDQPLETFRPVKAEPSRDQIIDNQDAPARLWQDPFGPVQQHQEELRKPQPRSGPASSVEAMDEHAGRHGIESLRHDIDAAPRAALAIIGVMVSSAAYAEDVERRQRYRYAVLAGLNRAGYVPDNGDHLGYVNVHSAASTQGCGERTSLPELIPFEWFSPAPGELSHERSRAAKVLVLWLSEHAFKTQPVKSIRALRSCLRLDAGSESALVTILAAGGSDQLRAIASKYAEAAPPKPSGRPIRIYAPTARSS
jgi:hypothetical protein